MQPRRIMLLNQIIGIERRQHHALAFCIGATPRLRFFSESFGTFGGGGVVRSRSLLAHR